MKPPKKVTALFNKLDRFISWYEENRDEKPESIPITSSDHKLLVSYMGEETAKSHKGVELKVV